MCWRCRSRTLQKIRIPPTSTESARKTTSTLSRATTICTRLARGLARRAESRKAARLCAARRTALRPSMSWANLSRTARGRLPNRLLRAKARARLPRRRAVRGKSFCRFARGRRSSRGFRKIPTGRTRCRSSKSPSNSRSSARKSTGFRRASWTESCGLRRVYTS